MQSKKSLDKDNLYPALLRIGVTGHRKLENEQIISESVKSVLSKLDDMLGSKQKNTPYSFAVISPLAEGADRLLAREVLNWNSEGEKPVLETVLPLPEEDYLNDFVEERSKEEFRGLLSRAKSVIVLEKTASCNAAYEQVGHYVVDNCDVLIAIWDGKPAAGQGGTADIVKYAQKADKYIFWIDSMDGTVKEENKHHHFESLKHLEKYNSEMLSDEKYNSAFEAECGKLANRTEYFFNWNKIPGDDNGRLIEFLRENYNIGWVTTVKIEKSNDDKAIRIYSEKNSISLILTDDKTRVNLKIDDGRTDVFDAKMEGKELNIFHYEKTGLKELILKPVRDHLLPHYIRADILAMKYQKRHMFAGSLIYWLAAAAVATATIYMLNKDFHTLLLVEFAEVALIVLVLIFAHFGDWQRKWLDYRFLAERIRVGIFLCIAGTDCKIPKPPPYLDNPHMQDDWTNRSFSWIWSKRPMKQPNIPFVHLKNFLRVAWIDDQATYYNNASKRHGLSNTRNTQIGEIFFALTILAVTFEVSGIGDALTYNFIDGPKILTSLAIILPTASAAFAGIRFHREYLVYSHGALSFNDQRKDQAGAGNEDID
jgi:hypothetical protein